MSAYLSCLMRSRLRSFAVGVLVCRLEGAGVLRIPSRFFNFVLLLGAGGCFSQFKQMRSTNNNCKLRSGYASDKLKRLEFTWW